MPISDQRRRQAKLPRPEVYEQEYAYWPWISVLNAASAWVTSNASPHAHVVDYMCGTGYLLNRLRTEREDVSLEGCDIDPSYVGYAETHYPAANVREGDALSFTPEQPAQIILCTAGIHHVDRQAQKVFVAKVAEELADDGVFIVGEEVIGPFSEERERQRTIVELGAALLRFAIDRAAPPAVLEAATDVLANDLLERGEYKLSMQTLDQLLAGAFPVREVRRLWPKEDAPYGDVLIICRKTYP
jgi:hypothetical protein